MSGSDALILGLIQGLTEFLPVSSSGHLLMFQVLLGAQQPGLLFEIAVHLATLASVLSLDEADLWPAIVDAVKVAPGYELALAAALGDDLNASADTAAPAHWREPGSTAGDAGLPDGIEPLSAMVDGLASS